MEALGTVKVEVITGKVLLILDLVRSLVDDERIPVHVREEIMDKVNHIVENVE